MNVRLFCIFLFLLCISGSFANGSTIIFPCVTPNAEQAFCMSLFECPTLMKSLSTLDASAIAFVKKSICLWFKAGDVMVCCGTASNFVQLNNSTVNLTLNSKTVINSNNTSTINSAAVVNNIKNKKNDTGTNTDSIEAHREHVKKNLLPPLTVCGQQHNDDRFILNNDNSTAIDEFPWIIHLKLSFFEDADRCTGVLISRRYILTDAYCGHESFTAILGQYTRGQIVSCTDDTNEECTEPVVEYQLYSKVRSGKRSNGPLDFSLIKLKKNVLYTDFIRPICLPVDGSKREEDYLTFSGWGTDGPENIKKKKLVYNVVDPEVCYNDNVGLEGNTKFANTTVVCLAPPAGNTVQACSGQRGGPLMYRYKRRWYTDGTAVEVNAKNKRACGSTDTVNGLFITPSVMNWILDNMHD